MQRKTRFIVYTAILTALSSVIKLYLGIPIAAGGSLLKDINLSPAVIMFSGMYMGPLSGGLTGALTDIIVALVRPMGAYMPVFTLINALMGIIPGLFFIKKPIVSLNKPLLRTSLATASAYIATSVILNTLILIWMGYFPAPVAWARNLPTLITLPIYIGICLLLKKTVPVFDKSK